jgi:GGDEF domain-containing protein
MGKTVGYVFLGLTIMFFLFLAGLTGYRIDVVRKANTAQAASESIRLLEQINVLRGSSGGFNSPFFKDKAHEIFLGEPRLLVLTVRSDSDGILYLIARNKSYVQEPRDPGPDWRGIPLYRETPGFEKLFVMPFPAPLASLRLDTLFVLFGKEDLFPILRDDLFLLFAFLIVCGIFLIISTGFREDEQRHIIPEIRIVEPPATPVLQPSPVPQSSPPQSSQRLEPPLPPRQDIAFLPDDLPHSPFEAPPVFTPEPIAPPPVSPDKSMISPISGLVWAEHFTQRLANEIERAASSDADLCVARIEIDDPAPVNETVYCGVARLLLDSFSLHDLVFEGGLRGYDLILPDTDIDQAVRALEGLRALAQRTAMDGINCTLSIGVSARGGRLVEIATLSNEAMISAAKALKEGGNKVVGFRADPSKFRNVLSGLEE